MFFYILKASTLWSHHIFWSAIAIIFKYVRWVGISLKCAEQGSSIRGTIGSTSVTDKIRLPEYSDDISFFEFLENVIQYFRDNPQSHLLQSTYVKEQMSLDGRFGVALNALIVELN